MPRPHRIVPFVASALLVGCGSAYPAPPTAEVTGVLPIARAGETITSVNGVDIAHETYEDDGDTLACHVTAMGKSTTVRLSRVARTAHVEQDGTSVNRLIAPGTVVVANFCWQQLVVAAEELRGASTPTAVRVLVPSRDVARDATIQVATTPTGERHVTLVIEGVEISADIGKDGAVSRVAIPVQNAEARGHAGVTAEATPTQAPPPVVDPVVVDEPFTIDRPDATVRGTLEMPKDVHTKIPIVLIVAGSGPTDRDGNSLAGLKSDAYKLLAAALAQRGIASLRYDKRGVGQSSFRGDVSKIVLGDFTEDARAIVLALKGDARFSSVSVLGHSEGGLHGLELTQTTPIFALVLVAAPGRPIGVVIREQHARQVDAPTLQAIDQAFIAVRAGTKPQNLLGGGSRSSSTIACSPFSGVRSTSIRRRSCRHRKRAESRSFRGTWTCR